MEPVVGIDLGTTYSAAAVVNAQGRPKTLLSSEGDSCTPSFVFLDTDGAVVGKEALKAAEFEVERVASAPKRDLGQQRFHREIRGQWFRPEVLQSLILSKLKRDAELVLPNVQRAVITVPASFNELRRKATQDAARMAGWDVLDLLNEPTAAAIAYAYQRGFLAGTRSLEKAENVLVYSLGGGTFDVTLLRLDKNSFVTLATAGDANLGGLDWDARLADVIAERFVREHGIDPRTDASAAHVLRREAEDAKRTLSAREDARIQFACQGQRLKTKVTRDDFEISTGDLLERTQMALRTLLHEVGLNFSDLSRLLVVGGASRMPMVTAMLEAETGLTVDRLQSIEDAVAHGAALYGHSLMRKANAAGATPAGDARLDIHIRNVCSHTLGLLGKDKATGKHRRQMLIARNSPLPAKKTQRFTTFQDNQPSVVLAVIEGGDDGGQGATSIGRCVVGDLPPALPKGTAVDVTFEYLETGRLHMHAAIPTLNKAVPVTIERAAGMSEQTLKAWSDCLVSGLPDNQRLPVDLVPSPAAVKPRTPAPAPAAVVAPAAVAVAAPIVAPVAAVPVVAAVVVAATAPPPIEADEEDNPLASLFGAPSPAPAAAPVAYVAAKPAPVAAPAVAPKATSAAKKPAAKAAAAAPVAAPVAAPAAEEDAPWMSSGSAPAHGNDGVDFESLFGNG